MAHIEYFSWSLQNFVFQHSAYWWMSFVFGHSCCHTKFSTQFDEFIHVVIPNFLLSLMNLWNRLRCDYFTAKDKLAQFFSETRRPVQAGVEDNYLTKKWLFYLNYLV